MIYFANMLEKIRKSKILLSINENYGVKINTLEFFTLNRSNLRKKLAQIC